MQATDKANRDAQRNEAYESLHYACLQAIEILKPANGIIDNINLAKLLNYKLKCDNITISYENINDWIPSNIKYREIKDKFIDSNTLQFKSEFFAYSFDPANIDKFYKKLAKVLPKYQHTYELQFFCYEKPENWNYCATISDKKEFKALTRYINKKDELRPDLQHIYIDAEASAIVASDSCILTARPIEAERSAMIPLDAQKYISDSKYSSGIYINDTGDKMRIVNTTDEKTFTVDTSLKYPKYKAVIPKKTDKTVIFPDKKELLKSIKLVAKNANQAGNLIKFMFAKNQCIISWQDTTFDVSSYISINCTSTISGEIGFNALNIEKALKSIDSKIIEFNLTDPSRAAIINDNCLIMPTITDCNKFEYITQQAVPIAEPKQAETTGRNLPVIYTAPKETTEAEPMRYLPILYIKPKKIRKPRAKKIKEPIKQHKKPDIWIAKKVETRENVAAPSDGMRKKRLFKYLLSVAMVCIILIINTDKVNGENNSTKREKIRSEVLQETKKDVHLYHNNSKEAVILNQSKMIFTVDSSERVFLVRNDGFFGLRDVFCNIKDLQNVIEAVKKNGNTAKVYHFWDGKLKVCPKKLYKEMIEINAKDKASK